MRGSVRVVLRVGKNVGGFFLEKFAVLGLVSLLSGLN